MRKNIIARNIIIAGMAFLFLFSETALAYWVWTPGTKKFINPKNAVKDSPKEQFEWAMTFYKAKDYQRAAAEFEKLTKQYEYSEYASRAQYHVGLCYENMNKFYIAYQNYQKAIDNFPHIENMDEIVAREFNIANMFVAKESPKVLGADILTSLDRAIEIYKKVVENAPYGRLADEAQFRMGQALKKGERYDEAIQAFQKVLDDYPASALADKAKFEVADCANKAALKPAYDAEPTARAIKAFEDFSRENRDRTLTSEADKTIQRLKDRAAEKSLLTAQFYEKQHRYQAAIIYYKDIIATYPESSFVEMARAKIDHLTEKLQKPKRSVPVNFIRPAKPKKTAEEIAAERAQRPKPEGVKLWNPFSSKKAAQPAEAVSEKPKAKGWAPFSFMKPAKPKETAPEASAETAVKPKSEGMKLWNPFKSSKTAQPKEAVPDAPKAKGWKPLSFDKEAKAKPEGEGMKLWNPFKSSKSAQPKEAVPDAPKAKGWKPLSFDKEVKPKETAQETAAETPGKPRSEGLKLWNPFGRKGSAQTKQAVAEAPKTKKWTPLSFDKPKAAPTVETSPAAPAETAPEVKTEEVKAEEAKTEETKPEETIAEEAKAPEVQESVTIPADDSEKPSEIRVTTDENEVKAAQPRPDVSTAYESGEENNDDLIEKTEY
ncbi:MAG: tetratricopeptide repeat protein [Candidatus Omnitrophica bacterium]|nr:tetratricopeptide repeat protein [Candidatus Omnitrophota bacterium]